MAQGGDTAEAPSTLTANDGHSLAGPVRNPSLCRLSAASDEVKETDVSRNSATQLIRARCLCIYLPT